VSESGRSRVSSICPQSPGAFTSGSDPLSQLRGRLDEIPRDRALFLYCAGGYRSSIAASLLAADEFRDVAELAGGIAAWEQAGQPLARRAAGSSSGSPFTSP
jgi:rhodanese-related sulfurtransferase